MTNAPTLSALAADLAAGRTTSRKLVEECLARIEDPKGEGKATFMYVDREGALAAADAMDALRKAGAEPSPYAGIPVSIKDLFDIKGQITRSGSRVLNDAAPAAEDATTVARLRRAGFVVIGRSNMVEFAYSGIGTNPHYGTPKSVWNREVGHVPGGSSSGAAISVTDGMAHVALGTDTGGSCRIPAAFNGIVGFKPTQKRVPLDGALPLSFTLDSIGPIGRTVECCAIVDAILADEPVTPVLPRSIKGMRLAVPTNLVFDDADEVVKETFERAIAKLESEGAIITRIEVPEFADVAKISAKGGFTAAEAYAWHRNLLATKRDEYDPRVSVRMSRGEQQSAADYIELFPMRRAYIEKLAARIAQFDALAMPTVAIAPPTLADMQDDATFGRLNLLALRNCTLINMFDGCAISVPANREGETPVGLMLAAAGGNDRRIFELAAGIEKHIRG